MAANKLQDIILLLKMYNFYFKGVNTNRLIGRILKIQPIFPYSTLVNKVL